MCQVVVDVPKAVLYDTHMNSAAAEEFVKQRMVDSFHPEKPRLFICSQMNPRLLHQFPQIRKPDLLW